METRPANFRIGSQRQLWQSSSQRFVRKSSGSTVHQELASPIINAMASAKSSTAPTNASNIIASMSGRMTI